MLSYIAKICSKPLVVQPIYPIPFTYKAYNQFTVTQVPLRTPPMPPLSLHKNPTEYMQRKPFKDLPLDPSKIYSIQNLQNAIDNTNLEILQKSITAIAGSNTSKLTYRQVQFLAYEFGYKVVPTKDQRTLVHKPPVVTIMGHVDHGKTTLLDALRGSQVANTEFGQITQKIGAFHNISQDGKRLTYIDTPGHEAFQNMRQRGGQCTDIVVLVVSASDGIQQQTVEVINLVKSLKVPIIVAINKIDIANVDVAEVEYDLYEKGNLALESFGGNIPVIHISAKQMTNIELLEELILFEVELMELKEYEEGFAEGTVLEVRKCEHTDQKSCTVLVQSGTLKVGDIAILGDSYCKIKYMRDDKQAVESATPSHAVEILGMKEMPKSGDAFFVVDDETQADMICKRLKVQNQLKKTEISMISSQSSQIQFKNRKEKRQFHSGSEVLQIQKYEQVEQSYKQQIEDLELSELSNKEILIAQLQIKLEEHKVYMHEMVQKNQPKNNQINLIIKTVDYGTQETLIAQIYKLTTQYEGIQLNLISASIGIVTEGDIREAEMMGASILTMDVGVNPSAQKLAKQLKIDINQHRIIYSVIDDIKDMLSNKLNNQNIVFNEGSGKVKTVFQIKAAKNGKLKYQKYLVSKTIAGITVTQGKFMKTSTYRVKRKNIIVADNIKVAQLRHFKEEVLEIQQGSDCGIIFLEFSEFQPGDIIEAYIENKRGK